MHAKIYVTLKKGVYDPQGEAVAHALKHLGYKEVLEVRMGKLIEIRCSEMEREHLERNLKEMCEKLLANTVIEGYQIELGES